LKLNSPSLAKLLRELNGIARHAKSDSRLGLQIATSLLFVENALDQINRLSDDFPERADALTARLLSIAAGETPQDAAPWLDELARQAQQRQTMMVLAGEMKTSLRQVEKYLDEYFIDASKRDALVNIDPILHQIGGALAILEQDDALRALQHTRAAVQRFAQPLAATESSSEVGEQDAVDELAAEAAPDRQALQDVAQNIGALGFFIEMLPQHSDTVKSRFSFDQEQGIFRASLLEKNKAVGTINEGDASALLPPAANTVNDAATDLTDADHQAANQQTAPLIDSVPTVEDELARHQQQSAALAV
jgi:chemosensory pili system protein ChpA (sensor histidine kinase/response regulator)